MDKNSNSGAEKELHLFPENPGAAIVIGMLFQKLGGTLTIGSDGRRFLGQIEPCAYRALGDELPQLPGAEPWEKFLSVEQWRGATRMLMYLVKRMDSADKDFLFEVLAPCGLNDSFDFREHMQ